MNIEIHNVRGISAPAEEQVACQEGLVFHGVSIKNIQAWAQRTDSWTKIALFVIMEYITQM